MGEVATERYIQSFIEVARQHLRVLRWRDVEPALAASWDELREPDTPSWEDVADKIRSACGAETLARKAAIQEKKRTGRRVLRT